MLARYPVSSLLQSRVKTQTPVFFIALVCIMEASQLDLPALAKEPEAARQAGSLNSEATDTTEEEKVSKEEAEFDKFRNEIDKTYIMPAVGLSGKGKHEDAIALYVEALNKMRELGKSSQWASTASTFDRHALHEYIAGEYRLMGKHELAAQTGLENFREQKELGLINAGLLTKAGEDFQQAGNEAEAKKALGDALAASAEANKTRTDTAGRSKAELMEEMQKTNALLRQSRIAERAVCKLLGKKDKIRELDAQLDDKHCPICGSDQNVETLKDQLDGSEALAKSLQWWCTADEIGF